MLYFFFSFVSCSRIIERFLSWNFYSIIATSFPKNFCNTFPRNLSCFFSFLFFFHCNFLFQKFQCCFSYCSNFLFSKLSFNVTLLFLDIFSLIKCRFLCKIKFLWTWLKNWSLNRNLHYSSNTIMHTRKNTLNIFACRAFSRYISYIRNFCINIRLFNYYYHKKKEKIPLQISHIYQCFLEYYKKKNTLFPISHSYPSYLPIFKAISLAVLLTGHWSFLGKPSSTLFHLLFRYR